MKLVGGREAFLDELEKDFPNICLDIVGIGRIKPSDFSFSVLSFLLLWIFLFIFYILIKFEFFTVFTVIMFYVSEVYTKSQCESQAR